VDLAGGVDFQGGEQVAGCLGDVGALAEGATGSVKVPMTMRWSSRRMAGQVCPV
jgi:hypothetical protein